MGKKNSDIETHSFPNKGELHIWKAFSCNKKKERNLIGYNKECSISSSSTDGYFTPSRRIVVQIAASYLCLDPKYISLGINDGGKPHIENQDRLHFNLSHCGDDVVVVFSRDPVGFDMERKDRKSDFIRVARRFFNVSEADEIEKHGEDLFLQRWTAKEAMLKLEGSGLRGGLANAEVVSPGYGRVIGRRVFLKELDWPLHYAHVASLKRIVVMREFEFKE